MLPLDHSSKAFKDQIPIVIMHRANETGGTGFCHNIAIVVQVIRSLDHDDPLSILSMRLSLPRGSIGLFSRYSSPLNLAITSRRCCHFSFVWVLGRQHLICEPDMLRLKIRQPERKHRQYQPEIEAFVSRIFLSQAALCLQPALSIPHISNRHNFTSAIWGNV